MALEFLNPSQDEEQTAAPVIAEPQADPAPQADAPVTDDQPRGPDGKFAPKEPATPPEPVVEPVVAEPQPITPPEPQIPPGYVPLAAVQETREKLRAAEAKLAQQQLPPVQPAPVITPPDRYEDPEGYEAWRDEQLEGRLFNERCNVSERFARSQHAPELVDEAKQWAVGKINSDPLFSAQLRSQPDPYGFAVSEYRKDKLFSEFKDDDFAAFQAWKASQGQPAPIPAPTLPPPVASVAPLTPAPPAPPRSIATAPSAGGPAAVPTGPGQGYDGLFPKG